MERNYLDGHEAECGHQTRVDGGVLGVNIWDGGEIWIGLRNFGFCIMSSQIWIFGGQGSPSSSPSAISDLVRTPHLCSARRRRKAVHGIQRMRDWRPYRERDELKRFWDGNKPEQDLCEWPWSKIHCHRQRSDRAGGLPQGRDVSQRWGASAWGDFKIWNLGWLGVDVVAGSCCRWLPHVGGYDVCTGGAGMAQIWFDCIQTVYYWEKGKRAKWVGPCGHVGADPDDVATAMIRVVRATG